MNRQDIHLRWEWKNKRMKAMPKNIIGNRISGFEKQCQNGCVNYV